MARMGGLTDLDSFQCPICKDILQEPVNIKCGNCHVFCRSCVDSLPLPSHCPLCCNPFLKAESSPANNIVIKMQTSFGICDGCDAKLPITSLRSHTESCNKLKIVSKFKPIKETRHVPEVAPNRSTFACPYCKLANLDCKDLIKHCNEKHIRDQKHVVCPVCSSMPWGNPDQRSINFVQHLNARHKFEYDTYVDYGQDDEAMLMAAIQASLKEH